MEYAIRILSERLSEIEFNWRLIKIDKRISTHRSHIKRVNELRDSISILKKDGNNS